MQLQMQYFLVSFVEMAMGAGIAMLIVDIQKGDK